MDKNLTDYIKQAQAQGMSNEQILGALREAGWEEEQIQEAFASKVKKSKKIMRFIRYFLKHIFPMIVGTFAVGVFLAVRMGSDVRDEFYVLRFLGALMYGLLAGIFFVLFVNIIIEFRLGGRRRFLDPLKRVGLNFLITFLIVAGLFIPFAYLPLSGTEIEFIENFYEWIF